MATARPKVPTKLSLRFPVKREPMKTAPKGKTPTCRVLNISKQTIALQVKPPGGDFYIHEQQVRLAPGQHALLPKTHLLEVQIGNLQKAGHIRITFDSEL